MGASGSQAAASGLRQRYDAAYLQCMAALGYRLPVPITGRGAPYRGALPPAMPAPGTPPPVGLPPPGMPAQQGLPPAGVVPVLPGPGVPQV